jgi:hypothetical protein
MISIRFFGARERSGEAVEEAGADLGRIAVGALATASS